MTVSWLHVFHWDPLYNYRMGLSYPTDQLKFKAFISSWSGFWWTGTTVRVLLLQYQSLPFTLPKSLKTPSCGQSSSLSFWGLTVTLKKNVILSIFSINAPQTFKLANKLSYEYTIPAMNNRLSTETYSNKYWGPMSQLNLEIFSSVCKNHHNSNVVKKVRLHPKLWPQNFTAVVSCSCKAKIYIICWPLWKYSQSCLTHEAAENRIQTSKIAQNFFLSFTIIIKKFKVTSFYWGSTLSKIRS